MKASKKNCDLKSCTLCKLCLKEWLPAIDANRKTFEVKKGEVIFKEGDPVTGIYFVYNGTVKVHKKWGDDKELIVRFAKKGDIAGHRGLGKEMFFPVSGTALEPSTVCFIELEFFLSSLKINSEFLFQLMMFFAEELKVSERNMRNLAHMQVKGRMAIALLTLKDKFGVTENGFINITLSRQDLASYAGTTYETVFRIMNEFIEDDIVSVNGKGISVLDANKLLEFTRQSI
ncbi:MAG TPA: Crp/Fnr family transcriptional regulator [Panacibacter sp.]|nr:Crp/Fnr family transcriptional regulator [Panacibacter sp.]